MKQFAVLLFLFSLVMVSHAQATPPKPPTYAPGNTVDTRKVAPVFVVDVTPAYDLAEIPTYAPEFPCRVFGIDNWVTPGAYTDPATHQTYTRVPEVLQRPYSQTTRSNYTHVPEAAKLPYIRYKPIYSGRHVPLKGMTPAMSAKHRIRVTNGVTVE